MKQFISCVIRFGVFFGVDCYSERSIVVGAMGSFFCFHRVGFRPPIRGSLTKSIRHVTHRSPPSFRCNVVRLSFGCPCVALKAAVEATDSVLSCGASPFSYKFWRRFHQAYTSRINWSLLHPARGRSEAAEVPGLGKARWRHLPVAVCCQESTKIIASPVVGRSPPSFP
jgi:hypothetical protein